LVISSPSLPVEAISSLGELNLLLKTSAVISLLGTRVNNENSERLVDFRQNFSSQKNTTLMVSGKSALGSSLVGNSCLSGKILAEIL
jgi:hypothetical protein